MKLAERVKGISPSPTLAVDARAKELIKQGVDVVNFGVGEPDFETPQYIREAGMEAIRKGFTRYTPAAGIPELREAICKRLARDQGLEYRPDEVVVSVGAKHALYNAMMVLCDPGDEVLMPSPYWVTYPEQAKLAGAVPVIVPAEEARGFRVTAGALEAQVTPRTRALILNSPNNPSGAVYSREELEAIGQLVLAHGLWLISDECYEKLVYDGRRHVSPATLDPALKERTVVVNAVSKAYAMTGWRIGWAACRREVARAMGELQGHVTSNPTSIAQWAALTALAGPDDSVEAMRQEFGRRRDYMAARLAAMPGLACRVPEGAFYVFPNISRLRGKTIAGRKLTGSAAVAEFLLEEAKVATVAGEGFGSDLHLRFSYATAMDRIETGLDRVEAALARI